MNLSYVLALIGDRGREVIEAFYGRPGEQPSPSEGRDLDEPALEIRAVRPRRPAARSGGRRLRKGGRRLRKACRAGHSCRGTIVIEVGVGDSIPSGDVIAPVFGGSIAPHDIRRAFLLGTERTMEQDPKFALRLLADVAIKALSSAINDPTTAVQALDQIEDLPLRIGVRTLDPQGLGHSRGVASGVAKYGSLSIFMVRHGRRSRRIVSPCPAEAIHPPVRVL